MQNSPQSDDELREIDEMMGPVPELAPASHPQQNEATGDSGERPATDEDKAVEAIVRAESDTVLAASEAEKNPPPAPKVSFMRRLGRGVKSLFTIKKRRRWLFAIISISLLVVIGLPSTRYAALNAAGVRVTSSIKIVDETTSQPIKKARVSIGVVSVETDQEGVATLSDLPLGPTELVVKKPGFAEVFEPIVLGWGSNPLGERQMVVTGIRAAFEITDWLSGKPISDVEIVSGESSVLTDQEGKARLVLEDGEERTVTAEIISDDYRKESVEINLDTTDAKKLALVPKLPLAFFSKRDGVYDLYEVEADGKNETLLVKGTGLERNELTLNTSPDGRYVAFVSSRDEQRNQDGYLFDGLFLYDRTSETLTKHASAEQIRLLGWVDDYVVYVKVVQGESAADPEREKLIAYDSNSDTARQLGASNQFNDIALAGEYIYVAESNTYGENPSVKLFRIRSDETEKSTLLDKQAWSLVRSSYDTFLVSSVGNKWHEYTISSGQTKDIPPPPSVPRDRRYEDNELGSKSVWYDYRDGKGVIVLYDASNKQETVLYSRGGLTTPLRWLSNRHVVFRLVTIEESSDYVMSIDGGEPKKVMDVVDIDSNGNKNFY